MQIAGIQKSSMMDYPGHVSIVLFTPYCNYDCFYCHNRNILKDTEMLDIDEIMRFVQKRAGIIDALVISGGEPTLQKGLLEFAKGIKDLGYLVKLDTNGSNLDAVKELIDNDVIDFVAIDLKCPFERYEEIARNADGESVKKTIEYVALSGIDYEIRTTMVPQLSKSEMIKTLKTLPRLKRYAVQQYKAPKVALEEDRFRVHAKPHTREYLMEYANMCKELCDNVVAKV